MPAAIGIAAVVVIPATGNPYRVRMGPPHPTTRYPDIASAPIPEAIDPHIARTRCVAENLDARRRRWRHRAVIRSVCCTANKGRHCQDRY